MKYIVASILIILSTTVGASFLEHASGVVGIYWIPCAQDDAKHIDIFSAPEGKTPIGKVYYAKQNRYPPNDPYGMRLCEEPTIQMFGKESNSGDRIGKLPVISMKDGSGAGSDGAVILRYKEDWVEIKLDKGTAWVHDPKQRRKSQSIESLISGDMSFLRIQPPVPAQTAPGGQIPVNVKDYSPYRNVKILEWRTVDGKLWVKVKPVPSPCGGDMGMKEYKRLKPFEGWLPFHDINGQPILWFYSAGC